MFLFYFALSFFSKFLVQFLGTTSLVHGNKTLEKDLERAYIAMNNEQHTNIIRLPVNTAMKIAEYMYELLDTFVLESNSDVLNKALKDMF